MQVTGVLYQNERKVPSDRYLLLASTHGGSGKPDWSWLREAMTAPIVSMDTYLDMPEELSRTIEVVDGIIVHCESPSENHQGIQQALVNSLSDPLELTLSWEQLDEWL